ncbi:uncharacterized protein LOC129601184 [Paramacrobiotus metropolitanus]|uniref:uncharacterized protein LOC129601184 n=1 Tax=Paramacrobiotus metropolitanus TaxID=2943436 RepID=UPI0024465577|nr:uncharacterized protein LOC129601184 [Paramacrobiotus metropolitanus]
MHVYGDNRHHSNAWNAVDVLVDGLLQHGDVIDVAKGGLIIDFRRAGHRAQFVKYGRIFRFSNSQEASATAVQVLLHRLPDGAWIWYPGTTVDMGDYHNEHLVCVQVPLYGTIPELVPRDQVRPPPADGEWEKFRVLEKDFVVRLGKLPDACGADGSQLAGEIFQRDLALWFDVWCISLSQCKRTLQYLQRQDASPVKSRRLEPTHSFGCQSGNRTGHPASVPAYRTPACHTQRCRKTR